MKKRFFLTLSCILISLFIIGCSNSNSTNESNKVNDDSKKLQVMVSIYPLKEFTEKIGGDKIEVTCLVPENMEPHDYEPKTKDFEKLMNSDIFIYNGLGMEHWIDSVNNVVSDDKVLKVNSSDGIDVRKEGELVDPHSWLSLIQVQKQCENIKDALISLDETNKDTYEENYNKFKKELQGLYDEYSAKFNDLSQKDFITGHAAFGYLCRDFGLTQKSVENLYGEGEPTPKELENLVNFCKENNKKFIFSESLASPKVSETLASEVGAEVVPIYTLESSEDDMSYLDAMKSNLDKIYKSLSK
ncbi:metal ABC transporter solute-binding protein, Zn/Mn family [Clostridium botulinum]|uniref:metal ABC transporter solute-binding protein, Zn/Mn family n=1 Tax=Clostridium botulinum TaxID=1491 RepID=UPI0019680FC7|nr:zinc ABC transporter substrate-binding protein [Clostridium botulinum]MBN1070028.1 ABC transporter substrate-binding protein [Clostridium botulinum]MBY6811157.1 zinc ABC transporter substrate-binding protein [Clostridium botulinum]MBY6824708.1 zinc ABC transporter substrate-binding protein [Clostridium botulinum]MBY6834970.1 zinc ABC transporter substrate-binding protein [Clostridium botulinum]MBY6974263.1 zinc ABC transporter substrate-binding protein [Clostridium botulinum]